VNYVAASGQSVYGGRFALSPSVYAALVGDSLTAPSYEITTATWHGGVAGGVVRPVANLGVPGETVGQVLARIDNSYTAGSPGLAGLAAALGIPRLGRVFLRLGTNDGRALNGWSAVSSAYFALVNKCLTYADEIAVCSVPPICAPESNAAAKDAAVQSINAGLVAAYGSNPAGIIYIDDGAALRVGGVPSGAGIASYFVDGIHMVPSGVRRMGIAGGDLFAAAIAAKGYSYASPLVTSNTDTYLANPASQQWVNNPAMLGSNAVSGSWTGELVDGFSVGSQGSGGGAVSIVTDGIGRWQRVAPTAGQSTGWTQLSFANTGRAITATDPSRVEAIVQVRFNALDVSNVKRLTFFARGNTTNNQYLLPEFWLQLGPDATTVSKTVTMRSNLPRAAGAIESGITLALALEYQNTFSGANIGSFDVRCPSLRG
jgi:hypothetical protein